VLDEAQRIRNWESKTSQAVKKLKSRYAMVLTGTPLENRLEELVSIVQLVDQHRLGPTWRFLREHQQLDDAGRVIGYRHLDRIGATLAPILLRRRKAEVLTQLPERVDQTLLLPMTPQQRVHHDENGQVVTRIVSRWRKTGYLSDVDQRRLQCALQNMRMSCNSTWLLDHETDFGTKADELVTLLEELFEQPDAKAVVFSQWLGTHEVLMRRLRIEGFFSPDFMHQGLALTQRLRAWRASTSASMTFMRFVAYDRPTPRPSRRAGRRRCEPAFGVTLEWSPEPAPTRSGTPGRCARTSE